MSATQKYIDGREGEKHFKILFSHWHALMVEGCLSTDDFGYYDSYKI